VSEERESRRIWWIAGAALALLIALRFLPEVENPLAPEPVAAHVALLADGDTVARDGFHELAAGRPFRLFAVLEAKNWRGDTVYFSEAPALALGERAIPAAAQRRWPEDPLLKVRWFTVEGFAPVLDVSSTADLERFRLNDEFHPEWGDRWTVTGVVDPRLVQLEAGSPLRPLPFGTQRYAVRIERFAESGALTPKWRAAAPAADAVLADPALGTRLVASLPPPLARLSGAFGRPELAPAAGLDPAVAARVESLVAAGLAFVRSPLIAAHLAENGTAAAALRWRPIDLAHERPAWGDVVAAGDLLQAGPRIVVLFRDEGEPGRLDSADLVFDLWQGLRIRRIDEIFHGEGGLELELATLPRRAG
jgi:hypothetical protein